MNWLSWLNADKQTPDACEHCLACRERLYQLAFSWTEDAQLADDLVQATFEQAMKKWTQVEDVEKMEQWACRVMRNLLHDHYRRQRPTDDITEYSDVLESQDNIEQQIERDELRLRVHHACCACR